MYKWLLKTKNFRRVGDLLVQERNLQEDPSHRLEVCRGNLHLRVGNLQVLLGDSRTEGSRLGAEDRAPHQGSQVRAPLEDLHSQGSLTEDSQVLQGNLGSLQQKEDHHQDNHQGILVLHLQDHQGLIHQEEGHQRHVASWMEGCAVMVCLLAECAVRRHPVVLVEETEQEMGWKGEEGRQRWSLWMKRVSRMVGLELYQPEACLMLSWILEMEPLWLQR